MILASDFDSLAETEGLGVRPEFPQQQRLDLPPGGPGDIDERRQTVSTVLYDARIGRYRMWYIGAPAAFNRTLASGHLPCYAESADGIHWEKPDLGLVEYNGTRHNNIVSGLPDRLDCASVMLDEDGLFKMSLFDARILTVSELVDEEARRFIGTHSTHVMPAFTGIAVSEDGIRWKNLGDGSAVIPEKFEVGRLYRIGEWIYMNGQMMYPFLPPRGRSVAFFRTKDLQHWEKLPDYYTIEDGVYDQCHVGIAPTVQVGKTMVGLAGHFHEAPELSEQSFDIDLAYSQDGIHWKRPTPGVPWLRRGEPHAWNGQGLRQAQGYAVHGDEMFFYYFASFGGNELSASHLPAIARFRRHRFAFATIRVYWDIENFGVRHGFLRTRMLSRGKYREIQLNCGNFQNGGHLVVSLTDATGKALPGFEKSLPVAEDSLATPVRWAEAKELPEEFCIRVDFYGKGFVPELPHLYTIEALP